jgi:hypothetical protein
VTKKPIVQGGVDNYLGKQPQVVAPRKWKSSPNAPETELAYITKEEKDLLIKKDVHGSLKGKTNMGPSGIMSLDGYGSADESQNVSGAAASAAERGGGSGRDRAEVQAEFGRGSTGPALAPGVTPQTAQDFRSAAIAAGAGQRVNPGFFDSRDTVSAAELLAARQANPEAFKAVRGGGLMGFLSGGGFFGNLIRSLGQRFGLGKTYDQPTYDMRRFSGLPLGGSAAFANLDIRDKFDRRGNLIVDEDDKEEIITDTVYPGENKNFFTTTDDLISTGVQEGPYRNMYDYLEAPPINQAGLVSTQQFKDSPFAAADFPSFVSDDIDEQIAIDNEIANQRFP